MIGHLQKQHGHQKEKEEEEDQRLPGGAHLRKKEKMLGWKSWHEVWTTAADHKRLKPSVNS